MNINMFTNSKNLKNRRAQQHMYLEKLSKERLLKEIQIKKMLDYTNHLINTTKYTVEHITDTNILTNKQNDSDIDNYTYNKNNVLKLSGDSPTKGEGEGEEIEKEIEKAEEMEKEIEKEIEKGIETDKYMTKLMQLINKILNNDINTFTYRELIKDDLNRSYIVDTCIDIKKYNTICLPIEYNSSDIISNTKLPMLIENRDNTIQSSDDIADINTYNTNTNTNVNTTIETDTNTHKNGKKTSFNFNKINKINNTQNNENPQSLITGETLMNKLSSLVKKVNDKVENEISKDMFMISQSVTDKPSKEDIVNLICSMILDKIETLIDTK